MSVGARGQERSRRLLLALDAACCEAAAIEAAVAIAVKLEAELEALFLEDADMIAVAELPFTHEVCARTARTREISVPRLERSLRALTREVEHRFGSLAGRRGGFRVVREQRAVALGEAVDEFDVLLLPALPARTRLAAPALHARVFALVDGGAGGERTLQYAALLARRDHGVLEIVCRGDIDTGWLHGIAAGGIRLHAQALPADVGMPGLLAAVENRAGNVVLVAGELVAGAGRAAALEALAGLRCQVLVVR